MPKKKMWVSWDDEAELSQSRKSPGDFSPLTRDSEKNLGQVILETIDDEDDWAAEPVYIYVDSADVASDEYQMSNAEMWARIVFLGVTVATRHEREIRDFWSAFGQPALTSVRERLSKLRHRPRPRGRSQEGPPVDPVVVDEDLTAALEEYREAMDSNEARERLIAALVAKQFAAEQLELLKNVRIKDSATPDQQLTAPGPVRPHELEAALRMLLERNPTLLETSPLGQPDAALRINVDHGTTRRGRVREAVRRRGLRK